MTFKWMRLPDADAAGKASADTTEVEIGNLTVPNWAKSILSMHVHLTYLRLTTDEEVAGYVRVHNDENTIDPLNFPLPVVQTLTGAIGTHIVFPITYPAIHAVTPNDILRVSAALDAATTGVHTLQAYMLLSSKSAPFNLKAQKSAVVAASTTANTVAGAATLSTIANRTNGVLGFWNYIVAAGGITVDETVGGYITVKSSADGWQEQRIPTPQLASGLSTQITPITAPMICSVKELLDRFDFVSKTPFPEIFPLTKKEDFNITNLMDGTNTAAPSMRYGMFWKE